MCANVCEKPSDQILYLVVDYQVLMKIGNILFKNDLEDFFLLPILTLLDVLSYVLIGYHRKIDKNF